jgi:hypothetical protein
MLMLIKVPEDYPQARYRSLEDSFPSFISFPASSPSISSQGSPPLLPRRHPAFQRPRPRNPTPASASMRSAASVSAMPLLDPMENNFARATAIREITLETRIPTAMHDNSLSSGDNSFNTSDLANTTTATDELYTSPHSDTTNDGSFEFPSYIDTSSSVGGILRARNSRAPPNTPFPTVRFEESPRAAYIRRKAIESVSSAQATSSLPGARYNASRRWARLGKIMERLDRHGNSSEGEPDDGEENVSSRYASPTSFNDPPFPETPAKIIASRTFSSSDSPISFARFDPPDPICSTPLAKFRFPLPPNRHSSQTDRSPLALAPSPDTSSSGLSGDVSSQSWSRRYMSDEGEGEETLEDCSALEALLEYGSSTDGEDEGKLDSTGAFDMKAGEHAVGAGSRRGSADLLPLKFKGLSMKVDEGKCKPHRRDRTSADTQTRSLLPESCVFEDNR